MHFYKAVSLTSLISCYHRHRATSIKSWSKSKKLSKRESAKLCWGTKTS